MSGPCAEWCGRRISFKLLGSEDFVSGEVYTYERCSDTLVICESRVGSNLATYRLLKGSSIDLATLKLEGEYVPPEPLPPLSEATIARMRDREELAVQRAMENAEKIAAGVTREAQLVFNGLAKTMRCKWDGHVICIEYDRADAGVRITNPYNTENVSGASEELVARVRKVLEGERAKLSV